MINLNRLPRDGEVERLSEPRVSGVSAMHRAEVRALFERVRAIDITRFESAQDDVLLHDLKPRTRQVLDDASLLLGRLLDECEPSGFFDEEAPSGSLIVDDVMPGHEAGVADLAFIAQVELRHRAERLTGLSAANLLAECDGALRRISRALTAVDRALARGTPDAGRFEMNPDLELSLRIRQVYAGFRRRIRDAATVEAPTRSRLLIAGREIAILVGLPFYRQLRLADRLYLRSLQQRLVTGLRKPDFDEIDGHRLWSDIVSFTAMLAQVNNRQELFEHDSRIVIRVVDSLSTLGELSENTARELGLLEGRDDDVDALLATGRRDLVAWAPVITSLANELGRSRLEGR